MHNIMKQTPLCRANIIISKFPHASLNIKLMLFTAYCIHLYVHIWLSALQYYVPVLIQPTTSSL